MAHALHVKLLVVPEHDPTRYELAAQFWLLHAAQEKPLSVPEQVPARYWLDPQVILEHVLQLNPLLVPEQPPTRYELVAQLTLLQGVHVCAAVLDPPCWNWLAGQAGWSLHEKPLLVPLHDPTRYCWLSQLMLLQALQTPGLLPDRHSLVLQATLEMSSHVYPLDVPLQLPMRR